MNYLDILNDFKLKLLEHDIADDLTLLLDNSSFYKIANELQPTEKAEDSRVFYNELYKHELNKFTVILPTGNIKVINKQKIYNLL
jgi:hypothetical protein